MPAAGQDRVNDLVHREPALTRVLMCGGTQPRPQAFGYGVGVGVPGYFLSIARLTSSSDLPCARIAITSRVTSRQIVQVAAWLVNVSVPSS